MNKSETYVPVTGQDPLPDSYFLLLYCLGRYKQKKQWWKCDMCYYKMDFLDKIKDRLS